MNNRNISSAQPGIVQNIQQDILEIPPFSSFTVLGDPGCDGLGTEVLSLYAQAMNHANGDFLLVAGDLVPEGYEAFYRQTNELIERTAHVPVYLLRGNHDTGAYHNHYGLSAYAVHDQHTLLVVLDNALGTFTPSSLALLERAVQTVSAPDLILAMHIPPPNRVTDKAVSQTEWDKLRDILRRTNSLHRLRYAIAGHVHSYFEDTMDGAVTLVTGGTGARIAPIDGVETPYHHYVEFVRGETGWTHRKVNLSFAETPAITDQTLSEHLQQAFTRECTSLVRYLLLAEDAGKRGLPQLEALYRAIAHAEFFHARNHFYTGGRMEDPLTALTTSIAQEQEEVSTFYPGFRDQAEQVGNGLAAATFSDASQAEQVHLELLSQAKTALEQNADAPKMAYYTCTSCGATFYGEKPVRCNVCGAPADKIVAEP